MQARRVKLASDKFLDCNAWIDLGCGPKCQPGFIGVDFIDHGQAIVWDLRNGIPLPDSCASKIFTSHFLEHLTIDEANSVFQEILRIAGKVSVIEIRVPHAASMEADYLDHFSKWDEKRILGIVTSWNNLRPWLKIVKNERVGMELQAIIEVRKP